MKPQQHLTYSTLAALPIMPLVGKRKAAWFWLSSILIDADHWLAFWWYFKNPSIHDALAMVKGTLDKPLPPQRNWRGEGFRAAHTLAFVLPFVLIGARWPTFRALASGFMFHIFLDRLDDRRTQPLRDAVFARDEATCRRCAGPAPYGDRRVWQLRSVYAGGKYEADNLVTLCRPCFILVATNTAVPRGLPEQG